MTENLSDREIKEIYERYASIVYSRCLSFLKSKDEAWDAVQEIFMKLIKSYSSIKNKKALFSWLMSTSTNFCISQLRKKRGVEFDENIHGAASGDNNPEKDLIIKDIMKKLFLPWDKKVREIVIYTYIDGYSQAEISKLTGMGESTIRRYLTKFRRKAKKWKEDQEGII